MYVANTILRIIRMVSQSLVGLGIGFFLGYLFGTGHYHISTILAQIGL